MMFIYLQGEQKKKCKEQEQQIEKLKKEMNDKVIHPREIFSFVQYYLLCNQYLNNA